MSAIALAYALKAKLDVIALNLDPSEMTDAWPGVAAIRIAAQAGVPIEKVTTDGLSGPMANVIRLAHAAHAAVEHGATRIIVGTTADATAAAEQPFFYELMGTVLSTAAPDDGKIVVYAPMGGIRRAVAVRWGVEVLGAKLGQTDDCLTPRPYARRLQLVHCGACTGCLTRRAAFAEADVPDMALYASAIA